MNSSWQRRYGTSVLFVVAALAVWMTLNLVVQPENVLVLVFFATILFSAWYGGLGPGLLALVLVLFIYDYLLLNPLSSLLGHRLGEKVSPSVFIVEGLLVTVAGTALYSARRRRAVAELYYREIVEGVKAIVWEAAAQTLRLTFVNQQAEEMLGYPTKRWFAEQDLLTSIIHPEDRERVVKIRQEAVRSGKDQALEYRVLTSDGDTRWMRDTLRVVRDSGGQVQQLRGLMLDITERKRVEEALQEAEEKYRSIFENAAEGIFQTRPDGTLLTANSAFLRILGYDHLDEISDVGSQIYVDPNRREEIIRFLRQHGSVTEFEIQGKRQDGSNLWLSVNARAVRDAAGEILYFEGTCRDITERKHTEERLKHSLSTLLALREAGQILGSTLEAGEIGTRLLNIMRGVSSLATAIIDVEDENGQLRIWRASGLDSLWPRARYAPEAESARQTVKSTGKPRLFRLYRPGSETEYLAGLCLPLKTRDRVIGVLEVYGPESLADNGTPEILGSLANQTASALENARLYGELAEREKRLENLIRKLLVTQEEERRRVAFEIHDGLAQVAAATHQHLQAFARFHPPQRKEARKILDKTLKLAQQTAGEARRVIANLIPTILDDFGLKVAIRSEIDLMRAEGWQVEYEGSLEDDIRLPVALETALFRISQEALRNVRKHANTDRVRVSLDSTDEIVRLCVRDWGCGFELSSLPDGTGPGEKLGLSSMEERVNLLGGRLEINTRRGEGTSVMAEVPLGKDAEASQRQDFADFKPHQESESGDRQSPAGRHEPRRSLDGAASNR